MKLHFESDLDYQLQAIEAVCDLFRGQELCRNEFSVAPVSPGEQQILGLSENELGVGNLLGLPDDVLLSNLRAIQSRNGIAPSDVLESGDFTVEMETGTGKTYVYLRTIIELNRRYGFTKFLIVVPSVAIKEGVYKTLQMTEEHFRAIYGGVPYEYFLYDSARLGQVRSFASSSTIQIMVVTVGAINKKDVNNLYKDSEKTGGERPIDLIRATHPILIVDEPQSVDGGLKGAGKAALVAMQPLCTLRYSATHADKHHMVYRLDAVDAYERKLVKQIEVASATIEDAFNKPFVRLLSVNKRPNAITARVMIDVATRTGVRRKELTVQDGDDLEATTGRALYRDCRIGELRIGKDAALMELRTPAGERYLSPGEVWGDVDGMIVQRQMIRRTIKEHLDKELRLGPQGIKVLSLFFIDSVGAYRRYDTEGNPVKGPYALMFEKEYRRLVSHPDYAGLTDARRNAAADVHDGYFSIDKRGAWIDTDENNQASRESAERAYHLIMRDKEALLDRATPLAFIFSHSALKEGWDNPNVFQICSLRDIRTERERRQTIGRGLRLCVDKTGTRVRGFDVNTLTVVANESYEEFAEGLQREIEADTGIRFGIVAPDQFAALTTDVAGDSYPLGSKTSRAVWEHLLANQYIDSVGRIHDSLRNALREGALTLPPSTEAYSGQITSLLRRLAGGIEVGNADERKRVRPRREVLDSPVFTALWERIKFKTTYRVNFDNARLINDCASALRDAPALASTRLQWRKADIAIGKAGIAATERAGAAAVVLHEEDVPLPDILTELQDRTQLTRRSLYRILAASERLTDFRRNPQAFIDLAADVINECKRLAIVKGIRYRLLDDRGYYAQERFETEDLVGYLNRMLPDTEAKSVYDAIVHESDIEQAFALAAERTSAVKVFLKLPSWFAISTPLGAYRPDWALVLHLEGRDELYFVVETKGSRSASDLREVERAKIDCGHAHFRALRVKEPPATYMVAKTLDDVLDAAVS